MPMLLTPEVVEAMDILVRGKKYGAHQRREPLFIYLFIIVIIIIFFFFFFIYLFFFC